MSGEDPGTITGESQIAGVTSFTAISLTPATDIFPRLLSVIGGQAGQRQLGGGRLGQVGCVA
ncbi:MAG: hypothetical protein FWF43_04500 [Propionibacteriaceae bacterium]|nr:hypothetical protein [Propionibacteriaceae bacterium]